MKQPAFLPGLLSCSPLSVRQTPLSEKEYEGFDGVLQIPGSGRNPLARRFAAAEQKRGAKAANFAVLESGAAAARCELQAADSAFTRHDRIRRRLDLLAGAKSIAVDIRGPQFAEDAVYAARAAVAAMPGDSRPPPKLLFAGCERAAVEAAAITADANILARSLCHLPPNVLTIPAFAQVAKALARKHGLEARAYAEKQLIQMKAGGILAVGRAAPHPPQIVRIRYAPRRRTAPRIALVGKGMIYDTGGVNVKPARHMRGMKADMAGAAAVLAAVCGAARLKLPLMVDAYLALAENAIGPAAYRPDDQITAMNGKHVEIIHSDAEGRMALADTLTLAGRDKPAAALTASFATLTGSMGIALGERMSGVLGDASLLPKAVETGDACGERLCAFPAPDDYKRALKSGVADIKQCAEEGEADHILAVLFLREFMEGASPWLHLDLSAASCKDGLGVAPGPETGFGAAWALRFLRDFQSNRPS